jgi:hypothetical protein
MCKELGGLGVMVGALIGAVIVVVLAGVLGKALKKKGFSGSIFGLTLALGLLAVGVGAGVSARFACEGGPFIPGLLGGLGAWLGAALGKRRLSVAGDGRGAGKDKDQA